MFIGREKELSLLKEKLNSGKKEVILVYGKRRIGKSTLIAQAAKDFDGAVINHVCIRSTYKGNLELLSHSISEVLGFPDMHFSSLTDIFAFLAGQNKKVLIVLDEYQYLKEAGKQGETDSYLQKIVDSMSDKIKLILCGSYISIMKELLDNDNPLFGRFTAIIHLKEFNYRDSALFYTDSAVRNKIELYSVFGGSPYVLENIDAKKDLGQNIAELIIPQNGLLRTYIENIVLHEVKKTFDIRILEAIGNGRRKYFQLSSFVDEKNTGILSKQLKILIDMETVSKIFPINKRGDSKKSFYVINDNLMRFYFRFVFGNDSIISRIGEEAFYDRYIKSRLGDFISHNFENIALQYFEFLSKSGIRNDILDIGSYWYDDPVHKKNGEFDCVVKTEKGYEFYECKFYKNHMTKGECEKEVKQISDIPYLFLSEIGFICSSGFDFTSDKWNLISGINLFQ